MSNNYRYSPHSSTCSSGNSEEAPPATIFLSLQNIINQASKQSQSSKETEVTRQHQTSVISITTPSSISGGGHCLQGGKFQSDSLMSLLKTGN
jgi:hypothetical protein